MAVVFPDGGRPAVGILIHTSVDPGVGSGMKRPGRASLLTSLGARRQLEPAACERLEDKHVTLAPGERLRLCDLEGPGRITRIWCTTPLWGQRHALRDAVWRMTWDGEPEPSVLCPLGDLFGAAFGRPHPVVSDRVVIAGGGYLCRFPMPFGQRALIEIENPSTRPLRQLFFQLGFELHDEPMDDPATFHAQFRRENPTAPGRPYRALEAEGSGRLAGLKVDLQNRSWWLAPPLKAMAIPRGFGLGLLEGWESVTVDGEEEPGIVGTGGEDYFNGGFYFAGGPFHTPTHGCSVRSFLTGRVSAYRFHLDDPIPFERSLTFDLDHGFHNRMAGDICSVAYWYQHEPHAQFPDLPVDRHPSVPWINPLQFALLGAVLGITAAAVVLAAGALWP